MESILLNTLDADRHRSIEDIRAYMSRIWAKPLHRHYTVSHSDRIVALLDGLTTGMMRTDKRLSPIEVYVLLAAAYLHDIGMQNEKFAGGDLDKIRDEHNDQSEEMIFAAFEDPSTGLAIPIVRDPTIAESIALVSRGHRKVDLSRQEYESIIHGGEILRRRLLAALLRFADELDIDYRRVDIETMKVLPLTAESQLHWWKCYYVDGVGISDEYIQINYRFPEDRQEYANLIVPLVEDEIRAKIASLEEIFRADSVKVALAKSQPRFMRLPQAMPSEVEDFAKAQIEIRKEKGRQQDAIWAQRLHELHVSGDVSKAQDMAAKGRFLEAAQSFAHAAELLSRARDFVQAKRYAVQSAEMYVKGNNQMAAAEQYLVAAEVWLDSALSPQLALHELERASDLIKGNDVPVLRVRVMLAQARVAFAMFDDEQAHRIMEQAAGLLQSINDRAVRANLTKELALQHSMLAMVWEKWTLAREILEKALAECPKDDLAERIELLRSLVKVGAEIGDWPAVDRAYQEAQQIGSQVDQLLLGLLAMDYAASLARRRALQEAHDMYRESLQLLERHANAYTLSLAYQNMQHMLLRHGQYIYQGFDTDEARRIDLFYGTQADNLGYTHEMHAKADLSVNKYRDALQHIRLALAHYWQQGAWAGIENSYQFLAALNASTGRLVEALLSAIRGSDADAAARFSKIIQDKGNMDGLAVVVRALIEPRPTASEQSVSIKSLAILSDVIPPALLNDVIRHLLELLQGPEENPIDINVRRNTVEALTKLATQFSVDQANEVVRVSLGQLQRQQFWTITEGLLKLLGDCFAVKERHIDVNLYAPVVDVVLPLASTEHFRDQADKVVVSLARTAPHDVRESIVAYLTNKPDSPYRLYYMAFLNEPIPEEELSTKIEELMRSINPKPQITVEGKTRTITVGISASRPYMLMNFKDILPPSLYDRVVDGLLETTVNEHSDLANRADAIWTLGELPTDVLSRRADEIAEHLLRGAEGTLPRSSLINSELQSQTDPFSNFRINMGNVEQVRQSSLRTLGGLYFIVASNIQKRIEDSFIAATRDPNPIVRKGVAMGLTTMARNAPRDAKDVSRRLLIALIVLLHDFDPDPCSWACDAAGRLIARGLTELFTKDLLPRVIDLATSSTATVEVRVGAAIALRLLKDSERVDDAERNHILEALAKLANDTSFRVRYEATAPLRS